MYCMHTPNDETENSWYSIDVPAAIDTNIKRGNESRVRRGSCGRQDRYCYEPEVLCLGERTNNRHDSETDIVTRNDFGIAEKFHPFVQIFYLFRSTRWEPGKASCACRFWDNRNSRGNRNEIDLQHCSHNHYNEGQIEAGLIELKEQGRKLLANKRVSDAAVVSSVVTWPWQTKTVAMEAATYGPGLNPFQ